MSGDEPPAGEGPHPIVGAIQSVIPNAIRERYALKFALVLLVMAVSIGLIGFVGTDQLQDQTRENVADQYSSVALQEADVVGEWLERNRLSTRLISATATWGQDDTEALRLALRDKKSELSSDVYQLHLVDIEDSGAVVAASTSLDSGRRLATAGRGWVDERESTLSRLQVRAVHVKDTYQRDSQRLVGFISPVSAQQDRYLLIEYSTFDLTSSLQGQERAEGGFTQVVNGDDMVVIGEDDNDDVPRPYSSSEAAREPLREAADLRDSGDLSGVTIEMSANDVMDETYTVGYAPVQTEGDTEWIVVTHAPQSSVFGFVQTVRTFGLLATLVAVILIGITGTVLGYSTSRSIDRLTEKTESMREGDLDVTLSTSRVDNIGRLYDGFAEMRDALKEQIREAESSRKEAEVARAEAEEMATYLQEKAAEYSEIMQQCAAGDLTQRMTIDGEEESMDRIGEEFNEMIEELEKTTGQLKSYVDEVEQAGAEVEQSANTVREASEQVADSIQTISDSAYDQKERLQDVSETMDDLARRLEDLAADHPDVDFGESLDRIREIASTVEETADLGESTMAEAENVAGAAEEQAAELNEVGERAHDLQRYAQPLRDILNRFETEAEHEFVFSVGPTGGAATPTVGEGADDEAGEAGDESEADVEGDDDEE